MMTLYRTSPNQLLALGALGAVLLWVVAFFNGTLDNMNAAIAKGFMPDGRALRSTYTGYSFLDSRLTYLTAFYEVLSNGLSMGPRLLFLDINFVISCTNAWVFIESRRRGVRNWALRHPVPFMILWNGLGAAFIQPLYFYLITQSKATLRDPTIPYNEAIALFIATLPTILFPLFLFAPAWFNLSTWDHHGYIATFLGSPFLIVVACLTSIAVMWPRFGLVSKKNAKDPNTDKPWIVASFVMAGTIAALVHVLTVVSSLTSTNPDISLTRLFVPSPSKVNSFSAVSVNSTLKSPALPAEYHTLLEGYHLFTQFDWIVIAMSCIVFCHYLLTNRTGENPRPLPKKMSDIEMRELAYIVLGSVVIGPGAAGSFALAVRESRLREENNSRKIQ